MPHTRERRIAYQKEWRDRNRLFIWNYLLEHPCVDCGENDPVVLEFDHRDPTTKSYGVARFIGGTWSTRRILEEIKKCDVRCANCHRRKTNKQFGFFRGTMVGPSDLVPEAPC